MVTFPNFDSATGINESQSVLPCLVAHHPKCSVRADGETPRGRLYSRYASLEASGSGLRDSCTALISIEIAKGRVLGVSLSSMFSFRYLFEHNELTDPEEPAQIHSFAGERLAEWGGYRDWLTG